VTLANPYLDDLPVAAAERLEEAVERFETAWGRGDRPDPATFLPDDGPRLATLIELVATDLEYRTAAGEPAAVGDYLVRFPELAAGVAVPRVGRFVLSGEIGAGAFGRVFRAFDPALGRVVAVKVPHPGRFGPDDGDRLAREAASAARLRHPGIATLFELVEDDGRPALVSEYVDGVPLSRWAGGRPVPPRAAAELAAAVADALDHAHANGVVHRDVKPSNILIDAGGRPRLLDFGLAKLDAAATLTGVGDVLGTPAYMAPEQAAGRGHAADARTDVYGLGAVLYELLTGERAFRGDARAVVAQVLADDPASPRRLNPDVPRDLETVCLKALAKRPADRYPTAAALADDLRRWLAGRPVAARPVGPAGRAVRWARRHPLPAGLAAALVLALAGGLFGVGLMWQRAERRRAEAEDHFRVARDAMAELTGRLEPRFDGAGGPDPVRDANARAAANHYRALIERRPDDPRLWFSAAQVFHANGQYARREGDPARSLEWFRLAIDCLSRLRRTDPADFRYTWGEARSWFYVAVVHEAGGRPAEARDPATRACRLYAAAVDARPDLLEFQQSLRNSYTRLVRAEKGAGGPGAAVRRLEAAGWLSVPTDPPTTADRVRVAALARSCRQMAQDCGAAGDADGQQFAARAAEGLAATAARWPVTPGTSPGPR
jgi:hypothetical protein